LFDMWICIFLVLHKLFQLIWQYLPPFITLVTGQVICCKIQLKKTDLIHKNSYMQ
jgi:hypothetical protein